jgi:glutamyl-tRNA reductase
VLEQLGIVGVSWRQGGSESLSAFTLPEDQLGERLATFAQTFALGELAYLATCNRVELIFARRGAGGREDLRSPAFRLLSGREPAPGEAERRLRAWQGEGMAEHLFLIATGLDSACVGETEIVGQVRASIERSQQLGLAGPALELVFEEALRIAARVRGETRLGQGRVSLAEIAIDHLRRRIQETPGMVALLGVAPMTERTAASLQAAGVRFVIVNRTLARAKALAARFGAGALALEAFCADPPPVEALLCSTGSPEPILREAALERIAARTPSGQAPLIVDLAVPADVDPEACHRLAIPRLGMDAIVARAESNRSARLLEAAQAREQVDAALEKLQERFAERYYGPLLGALQQRYRRTAREGVHRLLKKELKGLGEHERLAIEKWSEVLARRFAHIPCLGLRGLLYSGPEGSIEAFLSGLEPELADELRAALERNPRGAERRR